jgi:hypothetical protein
MSTWFNIGRNDKEEQRNQGCATCLEIIFREIRRERNDAGAEASASEIDSHLITKSDARSDKNKAESYLNVHYG